MIIEIRKAYHMGSFLKTVLVIKSSYHLEKNYHYSQMCAFKLIFITEKRHQNSQIIFREIIPVVNWNLDSNLTGIYLD